MKAVAVNENESANENVIATKVVVVASAPSSRLVSSASSDSASSPRRARTRAPCA